MTAGRATVRCPGSDCGATFEVDARRLGRNVYCLECGARMTARPAGVVRRLREQEQHRPGAAGAQVERLPLVVVVDSVRSLWNVGSIFRTADACGVERLLLTGITGHPPRPEIAKTALGAEETVAWSYHANSREALARVSAEGYTPVALENDPGATPLPEMCWPSQVCLVLGNEVAGVSGGVLDDCRLKVRIPMLGVKESLNVAVAFGVVACSAAGALLQSERTSPRGDDGYDLHGKDE